MLFNSYEFLFAYLPIVFVAFFAISRKNHSLAAGFLGLASLIFYGWFNPYSVPLLLASIAINYLLGLKISQGKQGISLAIGFDVWNISFIKSNDNRIANRLNHFFARRIAFGGI